MQTIKYEESAGESLNMRMRKTVLSVKPKGNTMKEKLNKFDYVKCKSPICQKT